VWDGKTGRQICLTRWTDGRLACVRFTADGKTLIVAGNEDKKPPAIWQIDPTTGAVLARRKLSLAQEYVGYNLSPDGTRIAVCDTIAKAVRVFETTADRELWRAGVGDIAWSDPAFALDGRTLAVVSRNRIYLFDSAGKEAGKLEVDVHPDACLSHVALSPDGSRVAACWSVRGFHLAVWNRTTGQIVWSRQTEPNSNAPQAFSPDGKWLLRVGFGDEGQRAAMLINAADGTDKAVFPQWDVPCCARFRSDGVVAVGGHEGTIRLYDPASGKPLTPSPDPPDGVQLHRFSSDGRTLFGWSEGWYAWDVPTGKQQRFEIETDGYDDVSPDGTRFARFAGEKDTARLEIGDIRTGKIIHTHRAPEFGDVSPWPRFTPDGKGVIGSLGVDGTTRVWAVDTGKEMVRFTQEHRQPGANAISADGRVFAAIDHMDPDPAHSIRVCDLRTGRELAKFVENGAFSVSLSADGRRVAVAVAVVGTAEQQERFPNPPRVTVWDVASGKILARVPQRGKCGSVELSPDGRTIAMRTWIGGIVSPVLQVYEVASGSERLTFHHDGRIQGFTFSPNGKLLAASSAEAPVYLWDMTGDLNGPAAWNPADANKVWDDLSSLDAAKAFTAIRRLRGNPTPALAFLKDRVKPLAAPNADTLKGLFADLAAEDFEVREKAVETLVGYDEAVRPAMERELNQSQSPEARLRLKKLITRLDGPTPIRLRLIRVVEAVEGMGTAEADALLATWAKEPAGSTLATEATTVLARRRN
jgi:WD40 repeat protein